MNCKIVNLDSIDYRRSASPVESSGTYFVLVTSAQLRSDLLASMANVL